MKAAYIQAVAGEIYTNRNGERYLCLQSGTGSSPGREMTAVFQRQPDGWTLTAHGVTQYDDSCIEWDYSTNGHFRGYGQRLSDKLRTETQNFNSLSDFERFVLDRGYLYDTEEELQAGYARVLKASRGILITAEEFAAEVKSRVKWDRTLDATRVYETLTVLVQEQKLAPGEVFGYAVNTWCLRHPEAIVAYQESADKWLVNNCDTEISEERARIEVCEEWGFEASRIRIIGIPYYDATDWQFIRFDCAQMTWLWQNGNLYQVYTD